MLVPCDDRSECAIYLLKHEQIAIKPGSAYHNGYSYHEGVTLPTGDALVKLFFNVPCPVCNEPRWVMGQIVEVLPDSFEVDSGRRATGAINHEAAFWKVLRLVPGVYFGDDQEKAVSVKTEIVGDTFEIKIIQECRHESYGYHRRGGFSNSRLTWGHQCDPDHKWLHNYTTVYQFGDDLHRFFGRDFSYWPGHSDYLSEYGNKNKGWYHTVGKEPTVDDCRRLASRLLEGEDVKGFKIARESVWSHMAWSLQTDAFEIDYSVAVPQDLKVSERDSYRRRPYWEQVFG